MKDQIRRHIILCFLSFKYLLNSCQLQAVSKEDIEIMLPISGNLPETHGQVPRWNSIKL